MKRFSVVFTPIMLVSSTICSASAGGILIKLLYLAKSLISIIKLLKRGVVKGTFGTFCLSSQIFGKCQTFCGAKSAESAKLLKKSIDFMYNRPPGPSHPRNVLETSSFH